MLESNPKTDPLPRRFIPEGCLRIAQRFSVGISVAEAASPEGTVEVHWPRVWMRYGKRLPLPSPLLPRRRGSIGRSGWGGLSPKLRGSAAEVVCAFSRPFGTWADSARGPNAEALGYCRMSLRDRALPILVGRRVCRTPGGRSPRVSVIVQAARGQRCIQGDRRVRRVLASLQDAKQTSDLVPGVSTALRPPATFCQPSGLVREGSKTSNRLSVTTWSQTIFNVLTFQRSNVLTF
jgi:hypothetical protein